MSPYIRRTLPHIPFDTRRQHTYESNSIENFFSSLMPFNFSQFHSQQENGHLPPSLARFEDALAKVCEIPRIRNCLFRNPIVTNTAQIYNRQYGEDPGPHASFIIHHPMLLAPFPSHLFLNTRGAETLQTTCAMPQSHLRFYRNTKTRLLSQFLDALDDHRAVKWVLRYIHICVRLTIYLFKPPCCEQLQGSFIRDFANVSKRITSTYLMFLSTSELIMMGRVFHLSTFQPPVDTRRMGINTGFFLLTRLVHYVNSWEVELIPFHQMARQEQPDALIFYK